jgi:hypothetical protein
VETTTRGYRNSRVQLERSPTYAPVRPTGGSSRATIRRMTFDPVERSHTNVVAGLGARENVGAGESSD